MTGSKLLRASAALMLAIVVTSPASSLADGRRPASHNRMGGQGRAQSGRIAMPVAPADRGGIRGATDRGIWPGGARATGARLDLSYDYPDSSDDDTDYPESYDDSDEPPASSAPFDGDAASYCAQRYRSYDPASGTYLGYDGLRHPCP